MRVFVNVIVYVCRTVNRFSTCVVDTVQQDGLEISAVEEITSLDKDYSLPLCFFS